MPGSNVDSETAAMYKQILLRPTAVEASDEPQDLRIVAAFSKFCASNPHLDKGTAGATAFTRNWIAYTEEQENDAMLARRCFLNRYEWPSLWETQEVQEELYNLWLQEEEMQSSGSWLQEEEMQSSGSIDPDYCHDREKPRATVRQYVALVGEEVAANLEGIARARLEKRPRQYQSDAAVHQAYMQATSGGGEDENDGDIAEAGDASAAPTSVKAHFEPIPYTNVTKSVEDMQKILDFKHRLRLTPFVKELLQLPCMQNSLSQQPPADDQFDDGRPSQPLVNDQRQYGAVWRTQYERLATATDGELLELAEKQSNRMEISHLEEDLDLPCDEEASCTGRVEAPAPQCFANQSVYAKPSAYISAIVRQLPTKEQLTRDQMLFMARFADACDQAWEDDSKPPAQRRLHHILLLGQGGSGKTHVVQKLVFKATQYIWPVDAESEPTLMVVASSNAQAKNISTKDVKARTLHNACAMRVQQYINCKMRLGKKQSQLTRVWNKVRVLVIEEVSMVAAALYNMLDFRSMSARSMTHDVTETTYKKPHHHFGRVPIVIHLGDFSQLRPTANISLIENLNARNADGSYKYAEPPSLEIQHAIRLFKAIPHVFELRGTKRFKAGDPLIELLAHMRAGRRFPHRVWKAFQNTFASDSSGVLDPRHESDKFREGFWLAMYWEVLARQIPQRAKRDALSLGVPLVFLQAVDQCNSIDEQAALRLLNVPNMHNTGHIHGVLPCHIGMRVRFAVKINSELGLVQEQKGTIVDFLFKDVDRERYTHCKPGELFRPRYQPAGTMLLCLHGSLQSHIHVQCHSISLIESLFSVA